MDSKRYKEWLEQVYAGRTKADAVAELQVQSDATDILFNMQEDCLNYLVWYTDYLDEQEIPKDHFLKATKEELQGFVDWLFS
jgi:hypothetical protein